MVLFSSFTVQAKEKSDVFIYKNGNVEIKIEDNNLSLEEKQAVANYIAYGKMNSKDGASSQRNLVCSILDHDLKTTSATETTHHAFSTSPKCLVRTYKVVYCTRSSCDYIKKDLISSHRTSACHG